MEGNFGREGYQVATDKGSVGNNPEVVPAGQEPPYTSHQGVAVTNLIPEGGSLQVVPPGGRANPDTIATSGDTI